MIFNRQHLTWFAHSTAVLISVVGVVLAPPPALSQTYTTTFTGSENPLSEGGKWSNNGVDWTDIRKGNGIAYSTQSGTEGGKYRYRDSYAILSGFPPDQEAWGKVYIAKPNPACHQELEILLRFTCTPHNTTGYECFARCVDDASSYVEIVRWDGPLGKFTYLARMHGKGFGLKSGDILKASIVGNLITVYINDQKKAQVTDDTFKTGNPGIGEFLACDNGQGVGSNADFGFASFTANGNPKPAPETLYHEQYRPQFHFTPRVNWTNDPNGLVFSKGEYHLFFQHNPKGIEWGNMTWGHAVSPDLVHWRQLPNAIEPDALGTIYSGSAVVDWDNTAGFQSGDEKTLVAIYTSAGKPFTQSIAYSNDRGRTWKKYEKNPVLGHVAAENRDPKVIWHAPTKRWVMALYLDKDQYALFASPNLREWTKLSDVPPLGATECPDMFELPVEGQPGQTKWIFWGGNGSYLIGQFDGQKFIQQSGPHRFEYGNNYYAAQTYSDIPRQDGRRIQIAWMNGGKYPGMPFNQQMSLPSVLTLRTCPEGLRLCRRPVKELDALRGKKHEFRGPLKEGDNPLAGVSSDLMDIQAEIEPRDAAEITLTLRGTPLVYDAKRKELRLLGKSAALEPIEGRIRLRVLMDRASIEVFCHDGSVTMSSCFLPPADNRTVALSAKGGMAEVTTLTVWQLKSAWEQK